jgi:hypothetical protein
VIPCKMPMERRIRGATGWGESASRLPQSLAHLSAAESSKSSTFNGLPTSLRQPHEQCRLWHVAGASHARHEARQCGHEAGLRARQWVAAAEAPRTMGDVCDLAPASQSPPRAWKPRTSSPEPYQEYVSLFLTRRLAWPTDSPCRNRPDRPPVPILPQTPRRPASPPGLTVSKTSCRAPGASLSSNVLKGV